jgi:hypothetical protein
METHTHVDHIDPEWCTSRTSADNKYTACVVIRFDHLQQRSHVLICDPNNIPPHAHDDHKDTVVCEATAATPYMARQQALNVFVTFYVK